METQCGYLTEDRILWVSTDEPKWKNRLMKLSEERPDEVTIVARPENNDGCLYLKCPASWLRIKPPKTVSMTDEQRAAAAERMKKARKTMAEKEPDEEGGDDDDA